MANHYLEFSEVLTHLSEEEADWLRSQLEVVYVVGDVEHAEGNVPGDVTVPDDAWIGCRVYRDMEDHEPGFDDGAGFDYSFAEDNEWGRYLWLRAGECGYVDRVAHLVRKFLGKFRPDQCWSLTCAAVCSKPRVGEFGGGGLFVTASEIKWENAHDFVDRERKGFLQQNASS